MSWNPRPFAPVERRSIKLVGVENSYFQDQRLQLESGRLFNPEQQTKGHAVCIIGHGIKSRFFATEEALGNQIKCGNLWLTVVGIMESRNVSLKAREELSSLGIRNYDMDVYIPIKTALLRYENRALVTQEALRFAAQMRRNRRENMLPTNYHQLDKIVMKVSDTRYMRPIAEISNRMLTRRHNEVIDFEITVPEELLRQKQRTMQIFNIVLGAIASISLIVGGIGIMNIMLASVLERIKEIGLRMSIGATPQDINLQFLSESIAISISGGVIGILLGIGISELIEVTADIETIVTPWSMILSFFVAVSIGLVFGIYPARRAAKQDPVVSLRSG